MYRQVNFPQWYPGETYFLSPRRNEYHRCNRISLLCSEWEEVGHLLLNHRKTAEENFSVDVYHLLDG